MRVLRFDDAFQRLVILRDGGVAEDEVCYSELVVTMNKHLGL